MPDRAGAETGSFTIRPYQPADEVGMLHVWNTAMWADPITAATWRSVYVTDPNFRRDLCQVAITNDMVVGFVLAFGDLTSPPVTLASDAWVVGFGTLPEVRRRGIATQLFDNLTQAVRRRDASRIVVGPYIPSYVTPGVDVDVYADAVRFLEKWGAATLSNPLSMKASLTGYRPPESDETSASDRRPERLVVREAVPSDILPSIEFVRDEFPHWLQDVASVSSRITGGDSRMDSLLVALDGDEIIGFAMFRSERFGPFGVREEARGRGVGGALLSATLMTMRRKGFHCAWFLWTHDRAARLYQGYGFEEVRRFAMMAKDISR